jgi:transcriptional regulator with PAS, ATPase and Fis domain
LLFRINTIQIDLPPLRERARDIELMAGYFLDKFSVKYSKGQMSFDGQALQSLKKYPWPGNIRELEHTIEKAVILAGHSVIQTNDLFLKVSPRQQTSAQDTTQSFEDYEKTIIHRALLLNHGNLSNAAKELGISRPTMYRKMKQYGL